MRIPASELQEGMYLVLDRVREILAVREQAGKIYATTSDPDGIRDIVYAKTAYAEVVATSDGF